MPAMKEEAGVWPQPAKEGRGARQSEGRGRVEQWREGRGERSRAEEEGGARRSKRHEEQSGGGTRGKKKTVNASQYRAEWVGIE